MFIHFWFLKRIAAMVTSKHDHLKCNKKHLRMPNRAKKWTLMETKTRDTSWKDQVYSKYYSAWNCQWEQVFHLLFRNFNWVIMNKSWKTVYVSQNILIKPSIENSQFAKLLYNSENWRKLGMKIPSIQKCTCVRSIIFALRFPKKFSFCEFLWQSW